MTDTYGSGEQHGHDLADHEHGAAQGHETETWHGDHAPVDDFAVHAEHGGEEAASVSEEIEHGAEAAETETQTAKPRSMLPAVAVLGLLLILGAGLYWQFGMNKAPVPVRNQVTQSNPHVSGPSMTNATNTNNTGNPVSPTTTAAPAMPPQNTAGTVPPSPPPPPADVATTTGLPGSTPTNTAPPVSAAGTVPPSILPPSAAPTTPNMATPAAASATTAPSTAALSSDIDNRINNLSGKVDDLGKSLDQATQKLNQLTAMMANQPAPAAANPAMDDRLNKIEQQLMQMQQHTGHMSRQARAVSGMMTGDNPGAAATSVASHKPRKNLHARAKPGHAHPVAPIETVAAPGEKPAQTLPAMAQPTNWVLRAATPNEAWVAQNPTTSDLRHIQVGDTLPGIGQVRAIRQSGDGWTIDGSQGSLH